MELSEAEKKTVARLRKKQENLRRFRWWLVLLGVCSFATAIYGMVVVERSLHEEDAPSIATVVKIALILPHVHLMCFSGAVAVGYALVNWNGNHRDLLLLRLVDEKPSQSENGS